MRSIHAAIRAYSIPEPVDLASGSPLSFGQYDQPSRTDLFLSGPWPDMCAPVTACRVFQEDTGLSGCGVVPGWSVLPEDQKDTYRAQAEAQRRKAWARFERMLAAQRAAASLAPSPPPPPPPPQPAPTPAWSPACPLTAFEVFQDELAAGGGGEPGFWEVLAKWEALPDKQRGMYNQRATQANRAANWKGAAAARAALAAQSTDRGRAASEWMDWCVWAEFLFFLVIWTLLYIPV